jgi:hypothetical protein
MQLGDCCLNKLNSIVINHQKTIAEIFSSTTFAFDIQENRGLAFYFIEETSLPPQR